MTKKRKLCGSQAACKDEASRVMDVVKADGLSLLNSSKLRHSCEHFLHSPAIGPKQPPPLGDHLCSSLAHHLSLTFGYNTSCTSNTPCVHGELSSLYVSSALCRSQAFAARHNVHKEHSPVRQELTTTTHRSDGTDSVQVAIPTVTETKPRLGDSQVDLAWPSAVHTFTLRSKQAYQRT